MHDAMVPLLRRHVVTISAYYGKELRQHATGSLVRFADRHFLVTAAHAIRAFDQGKRHYSDLQLLIDNGGANDLVPFYGDYLATEVVRDRERAGIRLSGEGKDLWDVGLWELDRRTLAGLTNKSFLNRRDILVTDELTSGLYYVAGRPCEWAHADSNNRGARWKWLRYVAGLHHDPCQLANFDKRFHVALNLDEDAELPKQMQGISGSPIWKLSELPVSDVWTVDDAKVVAVQTCVYPKRAICGTKWRFVLPVLTAMHPDIREVYRLWLPGRE